MLEGGEFSLIRHAHHCQSLWHHQDFSSPKNESLSSFQKHHWPSRTIFIVSQHFYTFILKMMFPIQSYFPYHALFLLNIALHQSIWKDLEILKLCSQFTEFTFEVIFIKSLVLTIFNLDYHNCAPFKVHFENFERSHGLCRELSFIIYKQKSLLQQKFVTIIFLKHNINMLMVFTY